jgi:hypothetical protein
MSLLSQGLRPARAAADAAGRIGLAGLDAVLGWRYTDEAVKRVLSSPVADRAVGHALSGPLVDAVARDIARYAVLERVVDELLADRITDQIADRLLEGPELEELAARVIDSRLLDTIVERLLESEELWRLVDEIASSPPVTEAIGRQSVGFADQVAGQVRVQSQRADARVERVARRLLRRRTPSPGEGDGEAP